MIILSKRSLIKYVKTAIICIVIILLVLLLCHFINLKTKPTNRTYAYENDNAAIPLTVTDSILIPDASNYSPGSGFTCTGLAYDNVDDVFWVGNYGSEYPKSDVVLPTIIKMSKDFKEIEDEIRIYEIFPDRNINLQGVAYDNSDDSLWFADGEYIQHVSKEGIDLGFIELGDYQKYKSNGICYDEKTDSLWVLFYYNYLVNFSKDGIVLEVMECDYVDQDQLCIDESGNNLYFSVGADYKGDENYLCKVDLNAKKISVSYKLLGSYAVEGISILDRQLYVMNDGHFHSALINSNLVNKYKLK